MNNIKIRNIFAHVFKQQENLQMPKFHFERENPTLKKLDSKMKTNFHEPKNSLFAIPCVEFLFPKVSSRCNSPFPVFNGKRE